ncbi:hypothetical protein CASFOL_032617 [Castilleja foliolosa]|uniref:Dirigent protein n=1 Tax=Castilleja foliolosa TaxID=1961234 RepID=A0ABD3C3R7_9LAMI
MATITNIFTILLLIISSSYIPLTIPHQFSKKDFGPRQKMTNLHFYFYDKPSSPNPTAKVIVNGTAPTFFGTVVMIDDALLAGPHPNSKIIGRAQGFYASADQTIEPALLMVVNYVFTYGKYNGSSLSVLGRNPVLHTVREMPILGGTGAFRFARGFALASTKWGNKLGDAIVEYNVTILHFENYN